MDKILFIINPIAGKGKAEEVIPIINEVMEKSKKKYKIVKTKKPKDAINISISGIKEGFSTIVAIGGDGTINEVASGLVMLGKGTLGIIPAGTGNDLARTLNIPFNPREALNVILNNKISAIDIGFANEKFFINLASVGFDSEIVKNTEAIKKVIKGKFAYTIGLLKTLLTYKGKKLKIKIDNKELERDILLLAVGNGKYYGGGMKICPMASMDDGLFHVCIIKNISKLKLFFLFPLVFKGKHLKFKKYVEIHKTKNVEIISLDRAYLNVDGEIYDFKVNSKFSILKRGLNVIVS